MAAVHAAACRNPGFSSAIQPRTNGSWPTTAARQAASSVSPVLAALRDPAEHHQQVLGAVPGLREPCQIRHRAGRRLVDRSLMQDAAVQLGERLGRLVLVPGKRPQAVGHIGGASVRMLQLGPGLGVDLGEEQCEFHGKDLFTRH